MNRTLPLVLALAAPALPALAESAYAVNLPAVKEGVYVHHAPTIDDLLAAEKMHPELKSVILKGHDLFMNTQQLRGKNVFNDLNCRSCHMGEGRMAFSGPIWPAMTQLPNYRPKNRHVNNLEERIAGCFAYSMNGIPPEYGSDTMIALATYHQWLAKGAQVYESRPIHGRGFAGLKEPALEPDYARGEAVYQQYCTTCHGADGQGMRVDDQYTFPPVWGDRSYNWGAGISRIFTAAAYIQWNMPLGQPGKLTDQEAWDVAYYINAHERPQDPRYTGDAKETREKYIDFHGFTLYGTEVNGVLLGQHDNTGEKPVLKPDVLRPRSYAEGSDALLPTTDSKP